MSRLVCIMLFIPSVAVAQVPIAQGVMVLPGPVAEGSLFRVVLDSAWWPAPPSSAEVAGEPVRFVRAADGSWRGLAAAPVGVDSVVFSAGQRRVAIPVISGRFPSERLRVAPAFGREPDSATAARIAAEVQRARTVSTAAHLTPRLWSGPFRRPRSSRITSPFGRFRTFNGAVQSRHMGVDFAGATGEPVVAANRGVVAMVADFYLAGKAVYVDHGDGLVTGYFHLSRADVAAGDTVAAGQRLGAVGHSGRVTAPHLHWIARYGAITINPLSLVALDSAMTSDPAGP